MESTNSFFTDSRIKTLKVLVGGGLIKYNNQNENMFEIIIVTFLILIIKSFIVMISYNTVIPKLIKSYNKDYIIENFYKINIFESILLILLFSNLLGR